MYELTLTWCACFILCHVCIYIYGSCVWCLFVWLCAHTRVHVSMLMYTKIQTNTLHRESVSVLSDYVDVMLRSRLAHKYAIRYLNAVEKLPLTHVLARKVQIIK